MNNSKSIFWILVNSCLVLVLLFGLIGVGTLIRYSDAIVSARTITVTGEGKTSMTPDLATLSFAVVSQGTVPADIQKDNTMKINKAIAFVKQQGILDADIQTTGYNLSPRYDYSKNGGTPTIVGYELSQTVTVKIHDLTKAGPIVGGLPATGINQINSLEYSIENPEAQRSQARQQAFNDAFQKARDMAAENGVSLSRVVTFTESPTATPGPIFYSPMAQSMGAGAAPVPPDVQPGSQDLQVSVSVTYEIR